MAAGDRRPRVAIWKFSSCDGCQLSLLDCEDELLAIAEAFDLAYFPEAIRAPDRGRYDVSLIEGSVTTPAEAERVHRIRRRSKTLVAIGACATSGGVQALRNFDDVDRCVRAVYADPRAIDCLPRSTPIADHVPVDLELHGCPIRKEQLVELLSALRARRRPNLPSHALCLECKEAGATCVLVVDGTPCLGPVTRAGCGAICPRYGRGCYGCFGPHEAANTAALADRMSEALAMDAGAIARAFRGVQSGAAPFAREGGRHER
jgi:coenzyme F420-reducing hydrogenase gamma subunit